MKRLFVAVGLLLLGSCTSAPRMFTPPTIDVNELFKVCEDKSLSAYPVKKIRVTEDTKPGPICKFDRALGEIACTEGVVLKQTEYDANERTRKAHFAECLSTKLRSR